MTLLTAILASAAPTAIYSLLLWWLDQYEQEPLPLLLIAFFWGAIPTIALTLLFVIVLALPLSQSPLGPTVTRFWLAPLVEEPLKALALVGLFLWARHEFDGPLDGIVYGALVGFGFAMSENALYYVQHSQELGMLFWVRSVLFGLNHAFFTSVVGLTFGAIRYRHDRLLSMLALAGGLALAILFHAVHNFFVADSKATGYFLSWLVESGGVIVILAVAVLSWRHERHWIEQELGDEIRAGIISPDDYAHILSAPRRFRHELGVLVSHGWEAYQQVRHLHHAMIELAFCKSQLLLADRFHSCDDRDRLRREIVALRATLEHNGELLGEH